MLAGGRSTRMGVDKAHADWHGTPLVVHVASLVSDAVDGPVVVVGAPDRPLPGLPEGVEIVEDAVAEQGPLQGLHDGLAALAGRVDAALATGVDAPLLRPEVVQLLARALERSGAQAAVPCLASDRRPLPAVYRVELAATAQRLLDGGERRLRSLVEAVAVTAVPEEELRLVDPRLGSLAPLNTPDELAAARRAGREA